MGEITDAREEMVSNVRIGATQEWSDAKGLDEEDFREAMRAFAEDGSRMADLLVTQALLLGKAEGNSVEELIEVVPETTRVVLTAIAAASFRLGYTVAEARMGEQILGE